MNGIQGRWTERILILESKQIWSIIKCNIFGLLTLEFNKIDKRLSEHEISFKTKFK